jgi:hypothetical protein
MVSDPLFVVQHQKPTPTTHKMRFKQNQSLNVKKKWGKERKAISPTKQGQQHRQAIRAHKTKQNKNHNPNPTQFETKHTFFSKTQTGYHRCCCPRAGSELSVLVPRRLLGLNLGVLLSHVGLTV